MDLASPEVGHFFLTPCLVGEGSPTKIDYRKKKSGYNLILTSLLEDLDKVVMGMKHNGMTDKSIPPLCMVSLLEYLLLSRPFRWVHS